MEKVFENWYNRTELVILLSKRDVMSRYRGSLLGFAWSFISPLFLLLVYTGVFGFIFKQTWPGVSGGISGFAVMLFCGLVPFSFFNEALSRGSQSILATPNFVKRVAFPTNVLPLVTTLSALVHAFISFIILIVMNYIFTHSMPITTWLVPIVMLPIIIIAIGASLVCATVGVFIRDVGHFLGLVFSILLFASPVFYPSSMFPEKVKWLLYINPIAYGAANLRKVIVLGETPDWISWSLLLVAGIIFLFVANKYYQLVKRRFSDVL